MSATGGFLILGKSCVSDRRPSSTTSALSCALVALVGTLPAEMDPFKVNGLLYHPELFDMLVSQGWAIGPWFSFLESCCFLLGSRGRQAPLPSCIPQECIQRTKAPISIRRPNSRPNTEFFKPGLGCVQRARFEQLHGDALITSEKL